MSFSPAEFKTMLLQMAFNWKSLFYVAQICLITKVCWQRHISFPGCQWDVTRLYIHNSTITSNYAEVSQNMVQQKSLSEQKVEFTKVKCLSLTLGKMLWNTIKMVRSLLCPPKKSNGRELKWNNKLIYNCFGP